jgi:hypothetical protein
MGAEKTASGRRRPLAGEFYYLNLLLRAFLAIHVLVLVPAAGLSTAAAFAMTLILLSWLIPLAALLLAALVLTLTLVIVLLAFRLLVTVRHTSSSGC